MKKAYVKPVFLAEEFVAASSYAASACKLSSSNPYTITTNQHLCTNETCDHYTSEKSMFFTGTNTFRVNGKDETKTYWEYAGGEGESKLFTLGESQCDFMWKTNGADLVTVWRDQEISAREVSYNAWDKIWDSVTNPFISVGAKFAAFFYDHGKPGNQQHNPGEVDSPFFSA